MRASETVSRAREDAAAVRVFPPGVPLAAVIAGVILDRVWPIEIGGMLAGSLRHWIGGAIVAISFLVFGVWSVVLFRMSGQDPNPWKPSPALVERGPFRITRNPMYVQLVGICLGLAVMLGNVWILALTSVVVWILDRFVIRHEEAYLERKFGAAYLAYKRRVRRWL